MRQQLAVGLAAVIALGLVYVGLTVVIIHWTSSSSSGPSTSTSGNQPSWRASTDRPADPTQSSWYDSRDFTVVIDAGSSGSRVQVYSWRNHAHVRSSNYQPEVLRGLPIIEKGDEHGKRWHWKETPGISTYATKVHRLAEHLRPLLDFALDVVPADRVSSTPVYLLATAGMRLLPLRQQSMVMDAACRYTQRRTAFRITSCDRQFQVIPGTAEGIYGWMAVNYLLDGFPKTGDRRMYTKESEDPVRHTLGFLDMGGASTQIAFEPTALMAQQHADDLTVLTLRNLDGHNTVYKVFTTTFLGFGSNEARRRYTHELVQPANLLNDEDLSAPSTPVPDPCLPPGLVLTTDLTSVNAGDGALEVKRAHLGHVTLTGTGSFAECSKRVITLLNKAIPCPTDPCLFNGIHVPAIDFTYQQFVGISEYWYSSHDVFGLGGVWDFDTFKAKATEYCQTPWTTIQTKFAAHNQADRLQMQCFKATWLATILHDGFGVPRFPLHHLNFTEELVHAQQVSQAHGVSIPFQSIHTVKDFEVSWTLGAALLHAAESIPIATDTTDHAPGLWALSTDQHATAPVGVVFPQQAHWHHHNIQGSVHSLMASLWGSGDARSSQPHIRSWMRPLGLAFIFISIAVVVVAMAQKRRRENFWSFESPAPWNRALAPEQPSGVSSWWLGLIYKLNQLWLATTRCRPLSGAATSDGLPLTTFDADSLPSNASMPRFGAPEQPFGTTRGITEEELYPDRYTSRRGRQSLDTLYASTTSRSSSRTRVTVNYPTPLTTSSVTITRNSLSTRSTGNASGSSIGGSRYSALGPNGTMPDAQPALVKTNSALSIPALTKRRSEFAASGAASPNPGPGLAGRLSAGTRSFSAHALPSIATSKSEKGIYDR
ncbi:Golgi apyrase [Dimargaris xerosporica]|nr:Golgi apyrase [Dimargaris xerosporica]